MSETNKTLLIIIIQISEIQKNIEEIVCLFQKVIFSLASEKYQKWYFTSDKYQLLDDFCFLDKFRL